jgi:hypothetical protein
MDEPLMNTRTITMKTTMNNLNTTPDHLKTTNPYQISLSTECRSRLYVEPDINLERIKWKSYLNNTYQDNTSFTKTDLERLSLTEYFHNLMYQENRILFHMTITYKPFEDRVYKPKDLNTFFINFYLGDFLFDLFGTKNFHTKSRKEVQPITFTFLDEHHQDKFRTRIDDFSFMSPERLHHHSMVSVHESHQDYFRSLPETNFVKTDTKFTKKIMTSHIRECEPMRFLYVSKMMKQYPDYLCFPDKFYRERH